MSVECEAKLIYGFIIDSYMAEELYDRDRELFDEFTDDDYTITLNGGKTLTIEPMTID